MTYVILIFDSDLLDTQMYDIININTPISHEKYLKMIYQTLINGLQHAS